MLLFSWSTNKFHLANQINLADNNLYIIRTDSHEIRLNPAWDEHARNYIPCQLGFYLGYLRGKSPPPPQMPSFPRPPPKKILLSLQYMSNYVAKIIQTWRGWWTHCNISQNCVLKCTRLHLSAYSFPKIFGGGGEPPDPLRMLVAFGRSGLLPYLINPR